MNGPVERGPNYNWEHEAQHYKEEANDLRKLLRLVEQSGDKAFEENYQLKQRLSVLELLTESYRAKLLELLEAVERYSCKGLIENYVHDSNKMKCLSDVVDEAKAALSSSEVGE